jgi:hypothetical protein
MPGTIGYCWLLTRRLFGGMLGKAAALPSPAGGGARNKFDDAGKEREVLSKRWVVGEVASDKISNGHRCLAYRSCKASRFLSFEP